MHHSHYERTACPVGARHTRVEARVGARHTDKLARQLAAPALECHTDGLRRLAISDVLCRRTATFLRETVEISVRFQHRDNRNRLPTHRHKPRHTAYRRLCKHRPSAVSDRRLSRGDKPEAACRRPRLRAQTLLAGLRAALRLHAQPLGARPSFLLRSRKHLLSLTAKLKYTK